jgi:lipoyl(octanoyl) transferase
MQQFTAQRTPDTPDEIWLLEHDPVFTLGLAATPSHLLGDIGIPVVQTDRGGEITYHGPGQLVAYLLLDLKRKQAKGALHVRELVRQMEQAIIDLLKQYGLETARRDGAPGIYLANGDRRGAKIAALGLKVQRNGYTYHGLALNVSMDLAPFSAINPCGYVGMEVVDMRSLGLEVPLEQVQADLLAHLHRILFSPTA